MAHTHRTFSIGDAVVGDLVVTPHGVSFFSVRSDLKNCDGRLYRSLDEAAADVTRALEREAA